jgi:hypothetical protein
MTLIIEQRSSVMLKRSICFRMRGENGYVICLLGSRSLPPMLGVIWIMYRMKRLLSRCSAFSLAATRSWQKNTYLQHGEIETLRGHLRAGQMCENREPWHSVAEVEVNLLLLVNRDGGRHEISQQEGLARASGRVVLESRRPSETSPSLRQIYGRPYPLVQLRG